MVSPSTFTKSHENVEDTFLWKCGYLGVHCHFYVPLYVIFTSHEKLSTSNSSHPVALLIRPDAGASHTTVDPIPFEDSLSPSASSVELHNPFSVLEKVAQEAPSTPSDTLVSHPLNSSPQNPLSNCFRPDISKNLSIDFCIQEEPPSPTNKSTNQATRAAPLTLIWSPSSADLATAVQPTTKKKKHERKKKSRTIEVTPPWNPNWPPSISLSPCLKPCFGTVGELRTPQLQGPSSSWPNLILLILSSF